MSEKISILVGKINGIAGAAFLIIGVLNFLWLIPDEEKETSKLERNSPEFIVKNNELELKKKRTELFLLIGLLSGSSAIAIQHLSRE